MYVCLSTGIKTISNLYIVRKYSILFSFFLYYIIMLLVQSHYKTALSLSIRGLVWLPGQTCPSVCKAYNNHSRVSSGTQ